MNLSFFKLDIDGDGIALLTWDMPERSMNIITMEVMDELSAVIEHVAGDAAIKGCVITSGKDAFSGGADLNMLKDLGAFYTMMVQKKGEQAAMPLFFEESRKLSMLYRRLETCGKPFAIAVHGVCLGGAFELALACHYRVLADDDKTRVGLPEVKVGLFPGAGGTQRVARLMQTGDALQMMFKGEHIRPAAALKMGLVHAVVPKDQMVENAKAWIKNGGSGVAPWDAPAFKLPSNKVHSAQGMQIWPPANAIYRRETQGNYPAAKAILQSVYEGLQLPMDLGLRVESRYFANILHSKEAIAMIRSLFVSMQELGKGARRPSDVPVTTIKKVGILGAGFMGASVAYVTANASIEVLLLDQTMEGAEKGKAHSHKLMTDQIMKGRAKTADREALLARITPTTDYALLKDCDLIIEAVFEDPKIKAEVIKKVEAVISAKTIFGSNTSTIPITSLATHSERPAQFIGIHFFSPVEKMMLVEIIKGKKTGKKALALALDYVKAIKKTPIVVNDSPGFYTSRVVGTYIREGHLMLMEGIPPAMIEAAGKQAGMPVGPLSLNDEVAVDLALKILRAGKSFNSESVDSIQEKLLISMVETHGRLGRKNGKGFYEYSENGQKHLWSGLKDLQPMHLAPEDVDMNVLKQRLLAMMALETARIVEEKVLTDPREGDVGGILGFGFAPYTGGPLSYIDGMGAADFVAICKKLQKACGKRFKPSRLLLNMAKEGETFYGSMASQDFAA
jgi:3-hydroxyacyl-CoA dehydrogenase / enoyl-CoA hydratase / 3-hydroxybutyryl-CoA epimerase